MKTLTIILACLLSSSAMAQKMTGGKAIPVKDEIKPLTLSDSAYYKRWTTGHLIGYQTINTPVFDHSFYIFTESVKAMTVSQKDSSGNYKVWIDPKRIVWTSDSTFILKTK